MRSHAKASSAGSTSDQGGRPGLINRGADATRALSPDADGRGAPSRRGRLAVSSIAAALLALALFASSAFASKEVLSDFGTTGSGVYGGGSPPRSGAYGGELNNPRDVAVNESGVGPADPGDTYVADEANNRIERFDANRNFISAWGKDTIATSINERQRIVIDATKGTYTLSFDGSTTAPLSYSYGPYAAFNVGPFLTQLPSVGSGNVEISGEGTAANPLIVTFQGALGGADQPALTADTSQLSGTVEISTIVNGDPNVPDDTGTGFETCTVAIECQAGAASGENGALDHPQSVAVDQDTGNVYVSDRGNRRIDEYDGEGNFIRAFGFGVAESGPGDTGTGYEVCNEADSDACKSGEAGSGVGQYGEGFAELGFGIAVSPADASASSGTVYLAGSGNQRVDTYALDGTSPSSFGSAANFGEGQPRSVAVDSRGIVYASDSNNGGDIQRYDSQNANGGGVGFLAPIVPPNNEQQEITFAGLSDGDNYELTCPNGTPTEELTYIGSGGIGLAIIANGLKAACGAANLSFSGEPPNATVTFKGALGAANQPQMTCTVLSGAGSCSVTTTSEGHPGPLLPGEASSATAGLAVNPAGSALYVLRVPSSSRPVVQQLGPTNAPGLTTPPSATDDTHGAGGGLSGVRGFGFNSASGRLYVAATGDPDGFEGLPSGHRVYVLDNSSALPNPTASTEPATAVANRSATFHGTVDPLGGLVGCKFQYSTDETNWTDVSVPFCAALDQDGGSQGVSQKVSGLVPDQKYFVRLQVTRPYFSGFTPVTSSPVSFTTASGPPLLSKVSANVIDEHSVRVSAMIDPSHSPTTYVIQYGATPALGSSTVPVDVGAGTQPIEVTPVIGGLNPATQYYFKLVATSLVGSTPSAELAVATFPSQPSFGSCPNDRYRTGPSAKLPDCRAYEQATPADKYGSDAFGSPYSVQASASGDGITSFTFAPFPGAQGFQEVNIFLSHLVDGEWSTEGTNPPTSYGDKGIVRAWSSDLRLSFASSFALKTEDASLVMRDSADGSSTVLIPPGVGFDESRFVFGGTFDNDSKVVFEANGNVPVTSGPTAAPADRNNVYLYDRDTEELTLAGLLPDSACASPPCVPSSGSKLPASFDTYVQEGHPVTPSGDIYFIDGGTGPAYLPPTPSGGLYLRRTAASPSASTVQVSASHKTEGGGPGGVATNSPQPASFKGATPDGSKAFFTSSEELTNDANTGPEPFVPPPPPPAPVAIGRANVTDGSGSQPNFIPTTAKWIAVDSAHVYWTNTEAGTIGRAGIGGASPDPSFITGLENPEGIAVDSGHLYWAEARDHEEGHGTIGRAGLDGSGELVPGSIDKEFITGAGDPHGVAISPESATERFVYWTNGVSTDIGRATIAGASPEQSFLARGGGEHPWGIAVNASNLYWIDQEGGAYIIKMDVGGGGESFVSVGGQARGISIDSAHIYWGDAGNGRIGRRELDFGSANANFVTGVEGVFGVATDASHIYWAADPPEYVPPPSPPSPGSDLYRYDAGSGELTDLAPDTSNPNGAQVVGLAGYSDDGSYVYFAANGDLDGAGEAQTGDCSGSGSAGFPYDSFSGSCSLYLWRAEGAGSCASAGGCVTFIVRLRAGYNWGGSGEGMKASRVSADGRILVFRSEESYSRYDADSGQTACLTCNPTGAPPVRGGPVLKNPDMYHAPTSHAIYEGQLFISRNLSADGNRFFFQTPDKLVPADVNGDGGCAGNPVEVGAGASCTDVYEWEAPGTPGGSCTTTSGAYSPANGGCIYLLSTGTGPYPSYLADVSESGDTAFIFSRQRLVPVDEDNQEDIYAVKVNGGLASQHAARPAACEGDACRGASSKPSGAPGAGSGVFEGPGNPKSGTNSTRCPKGKRTVHSKGKVRCVAKHKKHKKHAKQKPQHKRAANNNRRASR